MFATLQQICRGLTSLPCWLASWTRNNLISHGDSVTFFRNDSAETNHAVCFLMCHSEQAHLFENKIFVPRNNLHCKDRGTRSTVISAFYMPLSLHRVSIYCFKCLNRSKKNVDATCFCERRLLKSEPQFELVSLGRSSLLKLSRLEPILASWTLG